MQDTTAGCDIVPSWGGGYPKLSEPFLGVRGAAARGRFQLLSRKLSVGFPGRSLAFNRCKKRIGSVFQETSLDGSLVFLGGNVVFKVANRDL